MESVSLKFIFGCTPVSQSSNAQSNIRSVTINMRRLIGKVDVSYITSSRSSFLGTKPAFLLNFPMAQQYDSLSTQT